MLLLFVSFFAHVVVLVVKCSRLHEVQFAHVMVVNAIALHRGADGANAITSGIPFGLLVEIFHANMLEGLDVLNQASTTNGARWAFRASHHRSHPSAQLADILKTWNSGQIESDVGWVEF